MLPLCYCDYWRLILNDAYLITILIIRYVHVKHIVMAESATQAQTSQK